MQSFLGASLLSECNKNQAKNILQLHIDNSMVMLALLFKRMPIMIRVSVTGIENMHKIIAKGSTKAELIGADDVMPQMILTHKFIKAQEFTIDESVIFQDNLCAMMIKQNRMASSS